MRFGFKAWSLCTPTGYMVNFEVHQGENPRSEPAVEECFGKCATPLLDMINDFPDDLKNMPYNFYFDNKLTSCPLLIYLNSLGYNGTGTIGEDRIPASCSMIGEEELKTKDRGHCESVKIDGTTVRLTKWNDNNVVAIASTVFGVNPKSRVTRCSNLERKKVMVSCPCAVTEYDKNMGGVRRFDQDVTKYRIGSCGKKWWNSIFTWLIDACIQNAWYLHRSHDSKMTQFEFRKAIAVHYCERNVMSPITPRSTRTNRSVDNTVRFDGINHFVKPIEKKRRCAGEFCITIGRTACAKCDVGLCIRCFATYHTE